MGRNDCDKGSPNLFCFSFDWPKDMGENLKPEIEFIIKNNESLGENKIKNNIGHLLLKYKHGNDTHEHRACKFVPNLSQRLDLRSSNKHVALQNLSIYYTWKNIRKQYKNNKLKKIVPACNNEFELPDDSYSVSDIQDYFEYIIKKQ